MTGSNITLCKCTCSPLEGNPTDFQTCRKKVVTAVVCINDVWKSIAGDGNCLFRSILCSCGADVHNEAVLKLRAAYAHYFGNHQKRFKNAVTSQNIIRGSQHVQSGQFFQLSAESHTFLPLSTSSQRR